MLSDDISALVYSDGTVYYLPPVAIEAACNLDLKDYPYDSHVRNENKMIK